MQVNHKPSISERLSLFVSSFGLGSSPNSGGGNYCVSSNNNHLHLEVSKWSSRAVDKVSSFRRSSEVHRRMVPSIRGITRQIHENGVTEHKASEFMKMIEDYKKQSMCLDDDQLRDKENNSSTLKSKKSEGEEIKVQLLEKNQCQLFRNQDQIDEEDSSFSCSNIEHSIDNFKDEKLTSRRMRTFKRKINAIPRKSAPKNREDFMQALDNIENQKIISSKYRRQLSSIIIQSGQNIFSERKLLAKKRVSQSQSNLTQTRRQKDNNNESQKQFKQRDKECEKLVLPIKLGNQLLTQPVDLIQLEKKDEIQFKREQMIVSRFNKITQKQLNKYKVSSSAITEISENLEKYFTIQKNLNGEISIFGKQLINDDLLIELLTYLIQLALSKPIKLVTLVISNGKLSDAGFSILLEYLDVHRDTLKSLKLYNNIINIIENNQEVPYLLKGTQHLAKLLRSNITLATLELHGVFFHSEDIPDLFQSMSKCYKMRKLHLSNNNLQDFGVCYLAKVLSKYNSIALENITLYNNNIGDYGAHMIADALYGSETLQSLNLQMNFIKDQGSSFFVDFIRKDAYQSLRKLVLTGNQCSERMKRFMRLHTPQIII